MVLRVGLPGAGEPGTKDRLVKLTLELVSNRHGVPRGTPDSRDNRDAGHAWAVIEDAWRKATDLSVDLEERRRRQNWVGGALALYALFTDESASVLRDKLEASRPAPVATSDVLAVPTFQEGRSTPPPPRHRGAQTPVE